MSRTATRRQTVRTLAAAFAAAALAAALGGAVTAAAQQPIGTPVGPLSDHQAQPVRAPVQVTYTPQQLEASRDEAGGRGAAQPASGPRPAAVAAPVEAFVTRVDIAANGDEAIVIVHAGGAAWSISEPYYHTEHVRLHLDVAAPSLPRLLAPPVGGALVGLNVVSEPGSTRLEIDVAQLGRYEAREEDGRIVIRITPVAAPQQAVAASWDIVAPSDAALTARAAAYMEILRGASGRIAAGTRRMAAGLGAAVGPARGTAAAPAALGLLTLVVAGALLLRRRREPPRSVMLGAPRGDTPPAGRAREPEPPRARSSRVLRNGAAPNGGTHDNTARQLAEAGLSPAEISARLRVSRDVVSLMLATAREADDAAGSGRNFPAVRVPPRRGVFGLKR